LFINFLHQINSDTPHLVQFISRTPRFEEPNQVIVGFDFNGASVRLRSWTPDDYGELSVRISCRSRESDQRLSSVAQVCTMCLPHTVFPQWRTSESSPSIRI
jgi:hypothetical protein